MTAVCGARIREWAGRVSGALRARAGFTVADVMISVMVMAVVGAVFGSTLASSTRTTTVIEQESRAVDELRLAIARIERELRSAECIREPVPPSPGVPASGRRLRFTTRVGGQSYEVTYEVVGGELRRARGTEQTAVARHVVNASSGFAYVETPRRSIDIQVTIQVGSRDPRQLLTTIAGRNAMRQTC